MIKPGMMDRLSHLQDRVFDLVVIGGGVVGSGIARDAALRGLSVALFEKNDYSSGTTARSTRLIHGGLRYLETLDFRLVRLDLREREILLEIAPHLVAPLPFIVPFYHRSWAYRLKTRLGMMLYDLLSFDKTLPSHERLTPSGVLAAAPLLEKQGLQGGVLYYDAQVAAPERLVLENLIDARNHGAAAYNYSEVVGALRNGDALAGVRVRDSICAAEIPVKSRMVINAAGPWLDQVSGRILVHPKPKVRMTKGIHIVCPPLSKQALVLFSRLDTRLFFIVPWLKQSLVGTTDTDYRGDPGQAEANADEVRYLLESIRAFVPSISRHGVLYSYAGVRALVPEEGEPSLVSRMHLVLDEERNGTPGLISVIGGKITGYRAIAEEAVDMACAKLAVRRDCRTAAIPLPGGRREIGPATPDLLENKTVQHLNSIYGYRAAEVMDLVRADDRLRAPLAPGQYDIAAQVVHSVRKEQCLRATDFLLRRTLIGFSPDQGCGALPAVVSWMGEELGWSAAKRNEEFEAHMQWVRQTKECLSLPSF
jgi:glycerol-3-phosphate dehydrogenase